jgi:hypothetical protein
MTDKFVSNYEGKTVGFPTNKDYSGECLSLVKHYIQQRYSVYPPASGCNGARCYWSVFPNPLGTVLKKVSHKQGVLPQKGWIVVWDGNTGAGFGHIGIVLSATTTNFVSFDQNWGGRHAHKVTHDYKHVYGYLVPLKEESMISQEEYDKVRLERDANWQKYQEEVKKHELTTKQFMELVTTHNKCPDADVLALKLEECLSNNENTTIKRETIINGISGEITGFVIKTPTHNASYKIKDS